MNFLRYLATILSNDEEESEIEAKANVHSSSMIANEKMSNVIFYNATMDKSSLASAVKIKI